MWTPEHSKVLHEADGLYLCERLDEEGKPSTLAPRWFSVRIKQGKPVWLTVEYHDRINQGMVRLGLTKWVHPDDRK